MENKAKGRGDLLALLKQRQAKIVGLQDADTQVLTPKARGRAALLQKIHEKRLGGQMGKTEEAVSGSSRGPPPEGTATKQMSEMSLNTPSEPERCTFRGSAGSALKASANYIRMDVEKGRGVFEYDVRFEPELDMRSNRVHLLNEALGDDRGTKVFDGGSCLYLPYQKFTSKYEYQGNVSSMSEPVVVKITYKKKKQLHECLHLYNVLFKRIMNILLYTKIGKNYFSPEHKSIIPHHKLEIYPGYAVSVDEMEGGLMICLDTQHRVMRTQSVYEVFCDYRHKNPQNFKEEITRNIIGACVMTKYNNKTYTVNDIGWDMTPEDTFDVRNGGVCSYIDYYKEQYKIQIDDPKQPMLISKQTKHVNNEKVDRLICLVPELCNMTGLSDAMRSDFRVMKDVAAHTRVTPFQRMDALRTYISKVQSCERSQAILSVWGLKIAKESIEIPARVLPQEALYFGKSTDGQCMPNGDWNNAISRNNLTGPVDLMNWLIMCTPRDQKYVTIFKQCILRLAKQMGCIIKEPRVVCLADDRTETWALGIRNNVRSDLQVVVCVCSTLRSDRYSIIKKMCCTEMPIASQVILSKTLSNEMKLRGIVLKIAMQITCKLGGTLWSVKIPATRWMVCGIDIYHETNKKSVCGFVSSINESLTRFYSEALFQDKELGDFFRVSFRRALMEYKNRLGEFPQRVVIFRDGVGDGQLQHCKQYEVTQFQSVLSEMGLQKVGLVFVVVQKRINTRIYGFLDGVNVGNPPSGTVIDADIVRRNMQDFFLVPQSVRQGTVNPTHYVIVHNDCDMKPDHLERLAYKLCHLYYNWCGTIRVPAPCLYAHKLAALVGQYIKKSPDAKLADKLYYL